ERIGVIRSGAVDEVDASGSNYLAPLAPVRLVRSVRPVQGEVPHAPLAKLERPRAGSEPVRPDPPGQVALRGPGLENTVRGCGDCPHDDYLAFGHGFALTGHPLPLPASVVRRC